MGWARAVQKGEAKDAPDNVKQVAKTMKPKDLHDFASTKHDDLPEKAEKEARAKVAVFLIREAAGTDALVKSASKKQLFKYLKKAAQRFYRGEALAPALQAEFPGLSKEAAYKVARHVIVNGLKEASCGEPACPPHLPHKPKKKKAIIEKKSTIGPAMAGQQNAGSSYGAAPSMSMTASGPGMASALGSMGGTSAVGGLAKGANQLPGPVKPPGPDSNIGVEWMQPQAQPNIPGPVKPPTPFRTAPSPEQSSGFNIGNILRNPHVQGGLAAGGSLLGIYALMQMRKKKEEEEKQKQMMMMAGR
jgi:hypothetical protein